MTTPPTVSFENKFPVPGPGCSNKQSGSSAAMGISTSVNAGFASASSQLGTSSLAKSEEQTCNPDFNQTQTNNNKFHRYQNQPIK